MKTGVSITSFTYPGGTEKIAEHVQNIATYIDQNGFDSLWVMDHFFQLEPMLGKADEPMFEGYSLLHYVAALTQNVSLGTLVTGVHYRHPGFLLKQVTNLDTISGGRAVFGIGAGWYERESVGLGFPYPSMKERFEMLEETLVLAKQTFAGSRKPYEGKHFSLAEPIMSPGPIQPNGPKILIGGGGEQKTLRFVAKYADACNLFSMNDDTSELEHKLSVLKEHCKAENRDYNEIEKTVLTATPLRYENSGYINSEIERAKKLATLGIDHIIYSIFDIHNLKVINDLSDKVLPAIKNL